MSLKSINDGLVTLTENSGGLNAFVGTILGYTGFFKNLPKYLAELPARFQEVVPSFLTAELPSICERNIEPLLVPVKHTLAYVDLFATIKTVTDKDFWEKSVARKGQAFSKLIACGIDTLVQIPAKLQWYNFAGWLSSTMGSVSPYLQTAFSLDSFTLVGNIASIAASCFSIKSCADDHKAADKKIDLSKKNITKLSGALEDRLKTKEINKIAKAYCLGQNKTEALTKAYQEIYNKEEAIKNIEQRLDAKRKEGNQKAIDTLTKEKKKLYAELEITKEEIRRLHYFWAKFGEHNIIPMASKQLEDSIYKTEIKKFLKDQQSMADLVDKDPDLANEKGLLRNQVLSAEVRETLYAKCVSTKINNSSDEFENLFAERKMGGEGGFNPKDKAVFTIFRNSLLSTEKHYQDRITKIAPTISNKDLKHKIIKHIINNEIDRAEIDIRTQKSQKTRSWVIIAFEAAKIALTTLVATRPIIAIAAMAGVSLGVAVSAPVLAGISAALFGVGLVLSIAGLTRSLYTCFHWLDPKNQAKAETYIGELIAAS